MILGKGLYFVILIVGCLRKASYRGATSEEDEGEKETASEYMVCMRRRGLFIKGHDFVDRRTCEAQDHISTYQTDGYVKGTRGEHGGIPLLL
jgi:hypothetical protein